MDVTMKLRWVLLFLCVSSQFKRFHQEVNTELEKKTEMDVKYMNVREFV